MERSDFHPPTPWLYCRYVDLKGEQVYDEAGKEWNWDIARRYELEAPMEYWIMDGSGTDFRTGETWHYDGIEKITRENPYTKKQTEYTCHKIWTRLSINDYWDDDEINKKNRPYETTVCYYVTTDGNDLVYAKDIEQWFAPSVDLVCLAKADKSRVVTIPRSVRKKAVYNGWDKIEVNNIYYIKRKIGGKECLEVIGAKEDKATVTIPKSVKVDGKSYSSYEHTKITAKTYPVKAIKEFAFLNNSNLEKVTINADITLIDEGTFENANNLEKVIIKSKKLKKIGKSLRKESKMVQTKKQP